MGGKGQERTEMGLDRYFMKQRKLTLGLQRERWKKNGKLKDDFEVLCEIVGFFEWMSASNLSMKTEYCLQKWS